MSTPSLSNRIESVSERCAELGLRQCFVLQRILGGLSVKVEQIESVSSEELVEYIEGVVSSEEKKLRIPRS